MASKCCCLPRVSLLAQGALGGEFSQANKRLVRPGDFGLLQISSTPNYLAECRLHWQKGNDFLAGKRTQLLLVLRGVTWHAVGETWSIIWWISLDNLIERRAFSASSTIGSGQPDGSRTKIDPPRSSSHQPPHPLTKRFRHDQTLIDMSPLQVPWDSSRLFHCNHP